MNILQMLRDRRNRRQVYSQPDFWNRKAQDLKGHAVSMWANNHLNDLYHAELLSLLEAELPDLKGKKVLDLGCGTGRFSRWFADRGAMVTGVDFAEKPLEIARGLSDGDNPCYQQGSMFELRGEEEYDLVFACASVTMACGCSDELRQVAAGIYRVLRPGGFMVLLEPIHSSCLHRTLKMDVATFLNIFIEAGFQNSPARQLYFWPTRLLLAYIQFPRWLTAIGYHAGHSVMRLSRDRWGGDYKAIFAIRPQKVEKSKQVQA
jgi:2-polyprenyl-3-methyl-5-hydroxy-6-metoxy-1,4-benzoquinol methylase